MSTEPARTLLVIDDDADQRDVLSVLFEAEGYRVTTACDGLAALDLLHHGLRPSLIIVDLVMPIMGGVEFAQQKRLDRVADIVAIPVIVYSSGPDLSGAAYTMGAAAHVGKDRVEELIAAVGKHG